jgi:hypothetical protein
VRIGARFSPEHRAKLSQAKRGRRLTPAHKAAIGASVRKVHAAKRADREQALAWLSNPREILLAGHGFMQSFSRIQQTRLFRLKMLLCYALAHPGTRRKEPMTEEQLDALAATWTETMARLITAHTKAEFDAADFETDTLLSPLLILPVAQLRTFAGRLVQNLEADPRIPFLSWRAFANLVEAKVLTAQDAAVVALKQDLAGRIAAMVEEDVRPQIKEAIENALRWRDETTLKAVERTLAAGEKPRLKGRESCLYLLVGEGDGEVKVML